MDQSDSASFDTVFDLCPNGKLDRRMEVESIYGILICGILKGSEWRIVIIQLDKFNIAVFIIAAIIAMGRALCCTGSFSVSLFPAK